MADLRLPDLNKVFIAGRLTRDPELRYTQSNMAYCKLGLANTRYYKGKDGNRNEETLFVDVTVWGQPAEWIGERLKKGRAVIVEGRLRSSEWEDKETGQKRSRMEINADRVTPLEWDEDRSGGGARGGGGGYAGAAAGAAASGGYRDEPGPGASGGGYGGPPGPGDSGGGYGGGAYGGSPGQAPRPQPRVIEEPIPEDDIPF
jgi:single-strand DNA-binding protein